MLNVIEVFCDSYLNFFFNFFDLCLSISNGEMYSILLSIISFYLLCQFIFFKKLYIIKYWKHYLYLFLNNIILIGVIFLFSESFVACRIALMFIFSYYLFMYCIFNNLGIKYFSSIFPRFGNNDGNGDKFTAADMIANGIIES